jgi:hypothetical protein
MPFFGGFISKACRKNKVLEGISKKSPLAAGGKIRKKKEDKENEIIESIKDHFYGNLYFSFIFCG